MSSSVLYRSVVGTSGPEVVPLSYCVERIALRDVVVLVRACSFSALRQVKCYIWRYYYYLQLLPCQTTRELRVPPLMRRTSPDRGES